MQRPLVAFRADASVEIGSGHVMRCLTLADALAEVLDVVHIVFVCRAHPGHPGDLVERRGYPCRMLPAPPESSAALDAYERWLGVTPAVDADETRAAIAGDGRARGIVVDHYALGREWQRKLAADGAKVAAIDDLADRPHAADVLLDQSLGHPPGAYDALVPEHCERLLGPRYALLHPAFAARRAEALARRSNTAAVRRVLLAPGGTDVTNLAGRALEAIAAVALDVTVDVVLGAAAPHLAAVRAAAARAPERVALHVDCDDMAGLMAGADLAVGSCGMTAWERCALGVPSLAAVDGANQAGNAAGLAAAGAAEVLGPVEAIETDTLARALGELCADAPRLCRMSAAASAVCDGEGARRVAGVLARVLS